MSPPPPAGGREADARIEIDAALETDYLLFVDGKAVGVLEAKAPGHTLIGVEPQSTKYASGLPDGLDPPITPLPFLYLSTGDVTKFTNLLDPEPRSRFIFHVHRPETLAEWLSAPTLDTWVKANGAYTGADDTRPSSLRARLRAMPELEYFDAFLIGLTATPAKHTLGFFHKNLVMEYGHEQAVVDGVNVDFEIYKIRTKITEGGSTIDTEDGTMIEDILGDLEARAAKGPRQQAP